MDGAECVKDATSCPTRSSRSVLLIADSVPDCGCSVVGVHGCPGASARCALVSQDRSEGSLQSVEATEEGLPQHDSVSDQEGSAGTRPANGPPRRHRARDPASRRKTPSRNATRGPDNGPAMADTAVPLGDSAPPPLLTAPALLADSGENRPLNVVTERGTTQRWPACALVLAGGVASGGSGDGAAPIGRLGESRNVTKPADSIHPAARWNSRSGHTAAGPGHPTRSDSVSLTSARARANLLICLEMARRPRRPPGRSHSPSATATRGRRT